MSSDASARPQTRVRIPIRWTDLDFLGHVNQAVYHAYLEEGRGALLQERWGGDVVHDTFVLARVELDHRHEVRKDHGHVDVVVRVGRVGTKSITLENQIELPDGTVAAAGIAVIVAWDARERRARELTAREREALSG